MFVKKKYLTDIAFSCMIAQAAEGNELPHCNPDRRDIHGF